MINIIQLRTKAVKYAATLITAGVPVEEIETDLLNFEAFAPLIRSFGGDLYEQVIQIIEDGEDAAETARADAMERDARRYDEYLAEYPELDDVMKREC